MRIVGISSGGGHLTELLCIARHLPPMVAIITEKGAVERNEGGEMPFQQMRDPHRSIIGFVQSTLQAIGYICRYKPHVVISTGAGMTVPFFLLARISGAVCIFVETGARITTPSMTGRILYPFASLFVVQHESLLKFYSRAVVRSIL